MNDWPVGKHYPLKMYDGDTWNVIGHVERRERLIYVWTRNDGTSGTAHTAWGARQALSAPYRPWEALTPL